MSFISTAQPSLPAFWPLSAASASRSAVSLAASAVREAALAEFRQTGDKAPAKGVSIRLFKTYKYDATEAINWCALNAPTFLAIDAKRFERAAEQLDGAPVTIEYDPQPAIAGDLSEYLV